MGEGVVNRVEVMKACLAEAGYSDAVVYPCPGDCDDPQCEAWPHVRIEVVDIGVSRAIHRAYLLMGNRGTQPCFDCWNECNDDECKHLVDTPTP